VSTVIRRKKKPGALKDFYRQGCPLTHNHTPWCFNLCEPDTGGDGYCGRAAPHSIKGRTQLAIEVYNRTKRSSPRHTRTRS
jgi:hypothetical protein